MPPASWSTAAESKRESAGLALEQQRNAVGFYGYNSGNNFTYGFLNDPNLPAYMTVAATGTGSSTLWSTKTFLEITRRHPNRHRSAPHAVAGHHRP